VDVHGKVARLGERYADLELGLADSLLVLANRFRTRRLLTFDERDRLWRRGRPAVGCSFTLLPRDKTGS
jgi:hypothetical protein